MTDAREIISKCPKPGCGAQLRIANPCLDHDCPQDWTVKRLHAAGFRILGPDEVQAITRVLSGAWTDQTDFLHACREYAKAAPDSDIKRIRHIRADRVEERLADTETVLRSLKGGQS